MYSYLFVCFIGSMEDSGLTVLQGTKAEIESLKLHVESISKRYLENRARKLEALPKLYIITPTYTRYTQQADLIRMSNTLKHVANLFWILIEDAEQNTELVTDVLKNSGLEYVHLHTRTHKDLLLKTNDPRWKKHRGVDQRNHGLAWIRKSVPPHTPGIVYFADDDNTYHLKLFEEVMYVSTKFI